MSDALVRVERRHTELAIEALAKALKEDATIGIETIAQAIADEGRRTFRIGEPVTLIDGTEGVVVRPVDDPPAAEQASERTEADRTRDVWAMDTLDAWADAYGTQWHCGQSIRGTGFFVCRLQADGANPAHPKDFIANSQAAARWAAANHLAHWDNRFPPCPPPKASE